MARVHGPLTFTARPVPAGKRQRQPTTTVDGETVLQCGRGDVVRKGEPYYWFAVGFRGSKQYRCRNHLPKPSELDGSLMSEVLAAQESANEALDGITWSEGDEPDDIRAQVDEAIQEVKDAIESVTDQYRSAQFEEWADTLGDAEIVSWEAGDSSDPDDPEEGEPIDLTDWTAELVDEAREKVNDVSKE